MKTRELIEMPEKELAVHLKTFKLKEMEKHAKKILEGKCYANYKETLRAVIKAVPKLSGTNEKSKAHRFSEIQNIIHLHCHLPSHAAPVEKQLLQKVTVLMIMIIAQKFTNIHNKKTHTS